MREMKWVLPSEPIGYELNWHAYHAFLKKEEKGKRKVKY